MINQGSVLSPIFFSLYLDDLLKKLRKAGLGCHISGEWFGAAGYADDLILMSPSREAMSEMLEICESYANENNLVFSTDSNPSKSKSKCVFMCGKENVVYPKKLSLHGKELPYVKHANHLGHELSQTCTMDQDIRIKKAKLIDASTEIRETFGFAKPAQVLKVIRVYASNYYGSML